MLIKKHLVKPYLNKGTSEVPNWVQIKKATEFTRSMNPETEERDYIADENPTTELMGYKPSEELTVTTYKGEDDFELLYQLYKDRAIGEEAKLEVLLVSVFDSTEIEDSEDGGKKKTYYYAEKSDATVVLNEFNSSSSTLSATVYENGTSVKGYVEFGEDGAVTFTAGAMPSA